MDDKNLEIDEQDELSEYEFLLESEVVEEDFDNSKIKRLKKLPKTVSDVKIDFQLKSVKVYAVIPTVKLVEATGRDKLKGYKQKEVVELKHSLIFEKKFEFRNNEVIIENQSYCVPFYFNLDLILNYDKITWERLFYRILFDEIRTKINKYNS